MPPKPNGKSGGGTMFDDVCYKKSFLTEVVARIDFVAPVTAF